MNSDKLSDAQEIAIEDVATQIWNAYETTIKELLDDLSKQLFKNYSESWEHDSNKVISLIQDVGKISSKDDNVVGSLTLAEKIIEYKYELCRLINDIVKMRKEYLDMLLSMSENTAENITSSGIGSTFKMKIDSRVAEYEKILNDRNIQPIQLINEFTILNDDSQT